MEAAPTDGCWSVLKFSAGDSSVPLVGPRQLVRVFGYQPSWIGWNQLFVAMMISTDDSLHGWCRA